MAKIAVKVSARRSGNSIRMTTSVTKNGSTRSTVKTIRVK